MMNFDIIPEDFFVWEQGFKDGYLIGTLLTTLLLGGACAFLFWVDWLGRCA